MAGSILVAQVFQCNLCIKWIVEIALSNFEFAGLTYTSFLKQLSFGKSICQINQAWIKFANWN